MGSKRCQMTQNLSSKLISSMTTVIENSRLRLIGLRWEHLPQRESIGSPDCPLMWRWTLIESKRLDCKLLLHRFLPNASDPDCHDHPRPFVTAVLRGRYEDVVPCPECRRDPGWSQRETPKLLKPCPRCAGSAIVLGDVMKAGMIRRRSARHTHLTRTGEQGAWTVVLMGPKRRPWGFIREEGWWPFKRYEEQFGFHMRCDTESGELMRGGDSQPTFQDIGRASRKL